MGFTDNVFDQKRGQRHSSGQESSSSAQATTQKGHKRQLSLTELANPVDSSPTHRKLELPTPEPELNGIKRAAEYALDPNYAFTPRSRVDPNGSSGSSSISNSVAHLLEPSPRSSMTSEQETPRKSGDGMKALATAAASKGNMSTPQFDTILSPITPIAPQPNGLENKPASLSRYHLGSTDLPTPVSTHTASSPEKAAAIDESISQLEDQIGRLRRYGDELLELSLHDSHRMLSDQLSTLETSLKAKRREKSTMLINKLARDFPSLADATRREVEKLGYV